MRGRWDSSPHWISGDVLEADKDCTGRKLGSTYWANIWFIYRGLGYWAFREERQRSEVGVRWEAELSEGMGWEDGNTDYPHNEADKDSTGMKHVHGMYTLN